MKKAGRSGRSDTYPLRTVDCHGGNVVGPETDRRIRGCGTRTRTGVEETGPCAQ